MATIRVRPQVSDLDAKRAEAALEKLQALKVQQARLNTEIADQESYVVDLFRTQGRKSFKYGNKRATLVQGTRLQINEEGLAKALGARMWTKVSRKVLDRGALENLIALGEIKADVVSLHSETVNSKPYVRFTTQENESSES